MKTFRILVLLMAVLTVACTKKTGGDPAPDDTTAGHKDGPTKEDIEAGHKPNTAISDFTGEWKADVGGAGGFNNPESYKNFQFEYEVEGNNQTITYSVTSSDINVAFFLFNSNGERMWESGNGRLAKGEKVLAAGKYRIVVMADRYAVGKFTLKIGGINKNFTRLSFDILKSGEKPWGEYGGGGWVVTSKNHFYNFEVTEDNTWVDIEIESKDTEIGLALYDQNGELVMGYNGQRKHFLIARLSKGTYQIMAATNVRGAKGNYTLKVFGKTRNLNKHNASEKVIEGNITNYMDVKKYTIEINEDNSLIDIELLSPVHKVKLYIVDRNDITLATSNGYNNSIISTGKVPKGLLTIYIEPYTYSSNISGNFKLIAVGNIK